MTTASALAPLASIDPKLTHTTWTNLSGSSLALAISRLAETYPGPLILIAPDTTSALQLEESLHFFLKDSELSLPIYHFSDWETLPYDRFSPHQDITSQRILTLYHLPHLERGIVIAAVNTLMQRLPPYDFIASHCLFLDVGQKLELDAFRKHLQQGGYRLVSQVLEHGEYAIRGSLLDVFPMGSQSPYRIDLFDNEIEAIRIFDPETQLSSEKIQQIQLLPAREFPLTEESITQFRQSWRTTFQNNPNLCPVYTDISEGIIPAGIDYYAPLFFKESSNFFQFLPTESLILRLGDVHSPAERFWQEVNARYEQYSSDITRPILKPISLYLPTDNLMAETKKFKQVYIHPTKTDALHAQTIIFATEPPPTLSLDRKSNIPLHKLATYMDETTSRVLFSAESPGRSEVLRELLQTISVRPELVSSWQAFLASNSKVALLQSPLQEGLVLTDPAISLIVENQLFGERVQQQRHRKARVVDSNYIVRDLTELRPHSPVVHLEHGVGRYLGLERLTIDDTPSEFLILEYAAGDRIYVPVTSLNLISRYTGTDPDHAPLHKLGTEQWNKATRKAVEKIYDAAAELLELYAKRENSQGIVYELSDEQYQLFAASFPFEETPDQQRAISAIQSDMTAKKPMDRLICGDVGFGKTEVAMRAAFIAAQNQKQVAVLVPTTLLANQHFQNFKDRFAEFPITIELLSRFRSAKEQAKVLEGLKTGAVDIVVATHKILQKDIEFHNLGLFIVDEEHRFGVRQKEFIKSLRCDIDVLSLTATPIPRTLSMSMASLRDISLITTPPAKRLAIKTFCQEKSNALLRDAITREIMRGGQVFYLHNNIETIGRTAQDLQSLVPEAKIEIGHGQMPEKQLEQVMSDFYHHRFNILVCTTIIENGIDVPTANTIIIDRADRFGLAQLHQLRGRVGRSHHQAYAYLLTPPKEGMTADAIKRLEAIMSLEDLGAGFTLATHDLEIRGAGELLGEEQSGNMEEIGFTLYMELLDRAVNALKKGEKIVLEDTLIAKDTEINLNINIIIPENYIPDIYTRLVLYKRIAKATNKDELKDIQIEMIDRFGLLPESVKHLLQVTELKIFARALGIRKITANAKGGSLEFVEKPNIDPMAIIMLIQKQSSKFKLEGPQRLKIINPMEKAEERIDFFQAQVKNFQLQNSS